MTRYSNLPVYKYYSQFERDISLLGESKIFAPTVEMLNDPCEGLFEPLLLDQLKVFGRYSEKVISSFRAVIKKKDELGIFSLSKNWNNELLWAHYANSHKGMCIEFDLYYLLDLYVQNGNKFSFANLLEVKYQNTPPIIDITDIDNDTTESFFGKIIGTKSKKWAYEEEIRVLFENTKQLCIDYRAIKSITFGIRFEDKVIERFIKDFPIRIDIYKAKMTNGYCIERDYIGKTNNDYSFIKPSKEFIWLDNEDKDFTRYQIQIEKAIQYVEKEPYLEDIFYAGFDSDIEKGKKHIKINVNRNRAYTTWPVKFYLFEISGSDIVFRKEL